MGILSRLLGRKSDVRSGSHPVVTVAFRNLANPTPLEDFDPEYGYAYVWPFKRHPQVGDWAWAEGYDGPATVVVGMLGATPAAAGRELKPLLREVTTDEVLIARSGRADANGVWANRAKSALRGMSVEDFPPRAPSGVPGEVEKADEYGRQW